VFVKQQILQFNVPVSDAPVVTVADALDYLLEHTFGLSLRKSFVLVDFEIAVNGSTRNILHHYDNILARVNHFIKSDDVLASHFFHELDFSPYRFTSIWVHQLVFLVNFHSYLFVRWLVKPNAHDCISALTDLFANDVLIKHSLVAKYHAIIRIRLSRLFNKFLRLCLNCSCCGYYRNRFTRALRSWSNAGILWCFNGFLGLFDRFSQHWNRFIQLLLRYYNLRRLPKTALVRCSRHLILLQRLFELWRLLQRLCELRYFLNLLI